MAGCLPDIEALAPDDLKGLVLQLLEDVVALKAENAALREEIARLKGLKGPPKLKPSGMEKATEPARAERKAGRRGGKIDRLVIDEERVLKAAVPPGSRFKGYETYVVQELILRPHVIRYRRERWITPDGRTVVAALPAGTVGHFGPELRRFVLAQYHPGQVTVPRIVAQLRDLGMAISKRQVVRLLIAGKEDFLAEAAGVLKSGLESAAWITVDDTGARYKGMNGACTHIGNTDFAWFATTPREEPAELPGAFAGWRHRLRDQRRGAGLHARPEPLGAGDRLARWAQKQAPQRPGGVDGPSRAPRHHPAPGASRSAEDRHRRRAVGQRGRPWLAQGCRHRQRRRRPVQRRLSRAVLGPRRAGSSTSWSASTTASGRRVRGSGRGCGGSTPT